MIQIQIATSVTEQGVGDIRWVLLEAGEPVEPVGLEAGGSDPDGGEPVTVPARSHECDGPLLPTVAGGAEPSRPLRRWLGALALVASIGAAAWIASSLVDRGADDRAGRTSMAAQR